MLDLAAVHKFVQQIYSVTGKGFNVRTTLGDGELSGGVLTPAVEVELTNYKTKKMGKICLSATYLEDIVYRDKAGREKIIKKLIDSTESKEKVKKLIVEE